MAKQSPPMPVIGHSTTAEHGGGGDGRIDRVAAGLEVSMAVRLASGWEVAHIARRP